MNNIKRCFRLTALALAAAFVLPAMAQDPIPDQNKKGKWGFVDENGKKVIGYDYEEVTAFVDGRAKVKKGDKWGYINPKGKEVIKIKYNEMGTWQDGRCKVAENGSVKDGELKDAKWGYIDRDGKYIVKAEYSEIGPFKDGIAHMVKAGKHGYLSSDLQEIVPAKFTGIGAFNEYGVCWVAEGGKIDSKTNKVTGAKYGVYSKYGEVIIKPQYGAIGTFTRTPVDANPLMAKIAYDDNYRQRKNQLMKDITKDMQKRAVKAGLLGSVTGGKDGYTKDIMNDNSKRDAIISEAMEQLASIMSQTLSPDEMRVMAECGQHEVLAPTYIDGEMFSTLDMSKSKNFAVCKGISGFMKFAGAGKAMAEAQAQAKELMEKLGDDNTFLAFDNAKPGIVAFDGQVLLEPGKYYGCFNPTGDLIPVCKVGKTIKMGKDKVSVMEINYHRAGSKNLLFKKWLQATMIAPYTEAGTTVLSYFDNQYLIDRGGTKVSKAYDFILPAREGVHVVKKNGNYGMISIKGEEIISPSYALIAPAADGLFCAQQEKDGPMGYLNPKGEYAVPAAYKEAASFRLGYATVSTPDGWGIIDLANNHLVKPQYQEVKPFTMKNPAQAWVKQNDQWHALDYANNAIKFTTDYTDVANYDADGHAVVQSKEGKFGLIGLDGSVILPAALTMPELTVPCLKEMSEKGKTAYRMVDVYRFNAKNNPARNSFKLTDNIDKELWDF